MAAPVVNIRTVDLSTRVPEFPGVYGAVCIPGAKRGPVGVATLVTSETQLLARYTPENHIGIGYDIAYHSALAFLQKSNKLWTIRAVEGASYGAAIFKSALPHASSTKVNLDEPELYAFAAGDLFLIHGADPGVWNNDLSVAILDNSEKEAKSFYVVVYQKGVEVERTLCSRVEGHRDGFNRNIYIEDALKASAFVRAVDNPLVDSATPIPFTVDGTGKVTPVVLAGGDDGAPVTDGHMILATDQLKNRDNLMLTLVIDGGRATPSYQKQLIEIAEGRKDCVALLSVPYSAESNADYLNEIVDYRKNVLNANTSYAALYSPHVKVYDKFNDREIYVSPEAYAGAVISETAANQELWYPPAGFRRGVLNVLDVRRRFSRGEMDYLYDNGINPIRFVPGKGILVWGQKTLSARPSALDRLNVRLLLIVIQPAIAEALEDFVFEFNDEGTRAQIRAVIESYMSGIKGRRGVYDFTVLCDDSNNSNEDIDNNRLNVHLFIQPTKSAETINFTTVITRTGATVSLAGL